MKRILQEGTTFLSKQRKLRSPMSIIYSTMKAASYIARQCGKHINNFDKRTHRKIQRARLILINKVEVRIVLEKRIKNTDSDFFSQPVKAFERGTWGSADEENEICMINWYPCSAHQEQRAIIEKRSTCVIMKYCESWRPVFITK